MATQEQINDIIRRMEEARPRELLRQMDGTNAGITCVLRFLSKAGRPVSAGEISASAHVSSARVSVLLRKMEERRLIARAPDPRDARRSRITLSPEGEAALERMRHTFIDMMRGVVERVGYECMNEFIALSARINEAVAAELAEHAGDCPAGPAPR